MASNYDYLIIGGGMTSDAAIQGIREADPVGRIGVISAEAHRPYNRPPLSKALWKGEPMKVLWRGVDYTRVKFHLGRRATSVNRKKRTVTDESGAEYRYKKLLLATGGTPRRLPFGGDHVIYYRTLDDYERLRALVNAGKGFVVLGGGFIGSEVAAALRMQERPVTMIVPETGIGARVFPADLAEFLVTYYREKGVEVRTGTTVKGMEPSGDRAVLKVSAGGDVIADVVVAGLGIVPNVDLAEDAELAVENGIVVDEVLRTADPDIFAAGDVAAFENPVLGRRMRVEHEDNSLTMGRVAGLGMAGRPEPYHHLPFFYSDLFDLGYEAVGELDSRLEIVSDWKEPFREGVVYYLKDGRVRGVLLWNTWGQVDNARALIAEPGRVDPAKLKGRLPG